MTIVWTKEMDDVVRYETLTKAVKTLGLSHITIIKRRRVIGFTRHKAGRKGPEWTPSMDAELAVTGVVRFARKYRMSNTTAHNRKKLLGLPTLLGGRPKKQ